MIATVNSFAVPILSLAVVALSVVVFHLNRKLRRLEKPEAGVIDRKPL